MEPAIFWQGRPTELSLKITVLGDSKTLSKSRVEIKQPFKNGVGKKEFKFDN